MLNELHNLSMTLQSHSIVQQRWYDQYKPLPGGDCYRVWLDGGGSVTDVERMDKALVAICRKFGNNQQAFPAFNIAPLYRITSDDDREYFDALTKGKVALDMGRLRTMCVDDNWSKKPQRRIKGCLHKQIPHMPEDSAMAVLMRIAAALDVQVLRDTLEKKVWEKLPGDIKTYLPLLIHKRNERKSSDKLAFQ